MFFSLLVITVSFLPIFALEAQEGRLFKPLAYTKTFAMAAAALLSITLVPVLMMLFVRGRILPEASNPLNRAADRLYRPVIRLVLRADAHHPAGASSRSAARHIRRCGSARSSCRTSTRARCSTCRTTLPGLSVTKAAELLQTQNKIIKSFPEVDSVFGKAGRAATATDPAPLEMFETVINLKPQGRMAGRHDDRQADRRDGPSAAVARRQQCLDHADQGAHRHAVDRHPHPGRRQDLRHATSPRWKRSRGRSRP